MVLSRSLVFIALGVRASATCQGQQCAVDELDLLQAHQNIKRHMATRHEQVVVDGCPARGSTEHREIRSPDNEAAVRCCSMDGTSCESAELGCQTAGFFEAQDICGTAGLRLCSEGEIAGGVCCTSGCNFDSRQIWVSSQTTGAVAESVDATNERISFLEAEFRGAIEELHSLGASALGEQAEHISRIEVEFSGALAELHAIGSEALEQQGQQLLALEEEFFHALNELHQMGEEALVMVNGQMDELAQSQGVQAELIFQLEEQFHLGIEHLHQAGMEALESIEDRFENLEARVDALERPHRVFIGRSQENIRCVDVPLPVVCADDAGHIGSRLNTHSAHDTFEIMVHDGTHVCARRTDSNGGWGMQLEIPCFAA